MMFREMQDVLGAIRDAGGEQPSLRFYEKNASLWISACFQDGGEVCQLTHGISYYELGAYRGPEADVETAILKELIATIERELKDRRERRFKEAPDAG